MIRNGVGILFFIISGFFVYILGFLAFIDFSHLGSKKFLLMGGFSIPLIIFHLIGLAFYRGTNWKTSTAITLFIGGAFNILVVISILSIKGSPEIAEVMDTSSLNAFNDYISGFIVMAVFTGLGATLYLLGKSANKSRQTDASAVA
ncbi:MAG: hypothetical protein D3903_05965 [Candidatus Electrothrix sp. GM3_4]|nr:hypothetical protein [Candidatus Electrothrix sp. GM3_4]